MTSQTATAIARYSDSAEDLEIVCYLLDFQEIKDSPRKTQNPVTDFLVSRQATQSTSVKAFKGRSDLLEKNRT